MMKRIQIYILGALLGGLTATASAQTVYSNMVGFQKVHVQQGQQIMASTPFDNVTSTIADAFTGQVAGGLTDTTADNILKWDTATSSYRLFYQIEFGGNLGDWVEKGVGLANNEPFAPGEGVWVVNSQTPNLNTVVFVGEVPTDATRSVSIQPGLQMVHNPFPAEFSIDDATLSNIKAMAKGGFTKTQSDLVFQWNPAFNAYDTYWLLDAAGNKTWIYEPADPNAASGAGALVLEPGAAIWYQRLAAQPAYSWDVTRPYAVP